MRTMCVYVCLLWVVRIGAAIGAEGEEEQFLLRDATVAWAWRFWLPILLYCNDSNGQRARGRELFLAAEDDCVPGKLFNSSGSVGCGGGERPDQSKGRSERGNCCPLGKPRRPGPAISKKKSGI